MSEPPYGFVVAGRWYGVCSECHQRVRIDKPILGALHFCLTAEEKAQKRENARLQAAQDAVQRSYDGSRSDYAPR